MQSNKIIKTILSGIIFCMIFVVLSYIINTVILGEAHEKYAFLRSDTDFRIFPGLLFTSIIWSMLISISYNFFGDRINIEKRFLKGLVYGLIIYVFFILIQEFYYYLFIKFDFVIIAGALIHYLLTFTIGSGFIGLINSDK